MIYFVIAILLSLYFEFLGRWIALKFNYTKLSLYYPLGFFAFMAAIYPSSILTNANVSFTLIAIVYGLLFVASIVFIIKDIKKLLFKTNIWAIIFVLAVSTILLYYSFETTLGNLHGFDTLFYLNFTTGNVGLSPLNSKGVYLGGELEFSLTYYTGQTYYYFISVLLFVTGKVATLLGMEFYYGTGFIWIFQTVFYFIFTALLFESILFCKKKILAIVPITLLVFFFGKTYFNSVFGFFGNSLSTLSISYAVLFLFEYFKSKDRNTRYLVYLCLLASSGLCSSGIFALLIFLFGMFFLCHEEESLLKEYSVLIAFSIYNALHMERYNNAVIICISLAIFVVLFFLGEKILAFINKHKLVLPIFIFSIVMMFVLSRFYSNGLFDFSGFTNNLSESADMTIDYFSFDNNLTLRNIYKIFVLVVIGLTIIFNFKKPLYMFFIVLIAVFFNPFCCNFINNYISVYYRAYAIIINPFTLIMMFDDLVSLFKLKYVSYGMCGALLVFIVWNVDFVNPIYYHEDFIPKKGYNKLYKMNNNEIDIIRELKSEIFINEDSNPYIITGNLLTQSMIIQGRYLYGREYIKPTYWKNADKKLFEIFYPQEYPGDSVSKNPEYDNMLKYIEEARVDYLVVDKKTEFYDTSKNDYSYLHFKVYEICKQYMIYENESYVLYRFTY